MSIWRMLATHKSYQAPTTFAMFAIVERCLFPRFISGLFLIKRTRDFSATQRLIFKYMRKIKMLESSREVQRKELEHRRMMCKMPLFAFILSVCLKWHFKHCFTPALSRLEMEGNKGYNTSIYGTRYY